MGYDDDWDQAVGWLTNDLETDSPGHHHDEPTTDHDAADDPFEDIDQDDPFAVVDDPPATDPSGDTTGPEAPSTHFPNADTWLREWLLLVWQAPTTPSARPEHSALSSADTYHWCPKWWAHPEAVNRIEALWRSWEKMRVDPFMGMALWFRDQFDHHWPRLVNTGGPFTFCTPTVHRDLPMWQAIPIDTHLADTIIDTTDPIPEGDLP